MDWNRLMAVGNLFAEFDLFVYTNRLKLTDGGR